MSKFSNSTPHAASYPASTFKAVRGDVLRYYPDRPAGLRFTLERVTALDEAHVDRLILADALQPLGTDAIAARQLLIDVVCRDVKALRRTA